MSPNWGPNALYRNEDDGTFSPVVAGVEDRHWGTSAVFGDVDADGWQDLYVANDMTANFLFRNDGQARFAEVGLRAGVAPSESARPEAGMGTDFGDCDLVLSNNAQVTTYDKATYVIANSIEMTGRAGLYIDVNEPYGMAETWGGEASTLGLVY